MPTNPVIDARGESKAITQNLMALGAALKMAFMSDEQKLMQDPAYINAMANYERVNIDREKQKRDDAMDVRKQDFTEAEKQGSQLVAQEKLLGPLRKNFAKAFGATQAPTGEVGAPGLEAPLPALPESTTTFRDIVQNPNTTKNQALAAAATLLEDQQKENLIKDLTEGYDSISELLTPDMALGIPVAIKLIANKAPKEVYEQFLPTKILDMQKVIREMEQKKSMKEMDKAATQWLIDNGYLAQAEYGEWGYSGAGDMMYKARENLKQRAHELRQKATTDLPTFLKGDAMAIRQKLGSFVDPGKIAEGLRTLYKDNPAVSDGMLFSAAVDAAKTMNDLDSSNSVDQARSRLMYKMGVAPAANIIKQLNEKGVYWTSNMDRVLQQYKGALWAGVGTGGLVGVVAGSRGGPTGGVGARLAADERISDDFRTFYRGKLSPLETQLMNNVMTIMEAEMRELSGKRFEAGEIGREIQRRFVREDEKNNPEAKAQKHFYMNGIQEALRHKAGLPKETEEEMAQWPGIGESQAEEIATQQIVEAATREIFKRAKGNSEVALNVLSVNRQGRFGKDSPKEAYEMVREAILGVQSIDQQIEFLSKSNSPEAKQAIQKLKEERKRITGME